MKKRWMYLLFLGLFSKFVLGLDGLMAYSPIDFYEMYPYWFDFFIAFFIFIGISSTAFSKQFKEGSNKLIVFGVSFALAMGLVYWEMLNGFYLLSFGHIAILILFLIIVFLMYKLIHRLTRSMMAGICFGYASAYIIFFYILGLGINLSSGTGLIDILSFLDLMFWISLILGVISLFFKEPKK